MWGGGGRNSTYLQIFTRGWAAQGFIVKIYPTKKLIFEKRFQRHTEHRKNWLIKCQIKPRKNAYSAMPMEKITPFAAISMPQTFFVEIGMCWNLFPKICCCFEPVSCTPKNCSVVPIAAEELLRHFRNRYFITVSVTLSMSSSMFPAVSQYVSLSRSRACPCPDLCPCPCVFSGKWTNFRKLAF